MNKPKNDKLKDSAKSDNDLKKLLSFASKIPFDEELDNEKYPFSGVRYIESPVRIGWTEDKFKECINFGKNKLPALARYLPDELISNNIRSFVLSAYENPLITDFSELITKFDEEHLTLQNVVIKLYKIEMEQDFIDSPAFSLYKQDIFFKTHIKNMLETFPHKLWADSIKETYAVKPNTQPFIILLLKDVVIYKDSQNITQDIIKERAEEILYALSVVSKSKYAAKNLNDYFKYSVLAYSIFTKDMMPVETSDVIELKTPFYKEPFYISEKDIKSNIVELLSSQDKFKNKIRKSVRWLGKSLVSENLDDSFLNLVISLECLLSRSEKGIVTPSISFSLSEALTFLIETNPKNRSIKFNDIKEMYGLRSAIVHNGQGNITFNTFDRYFNYINQGLLNLLELIEKNHWNSIDNFYTYIEELRFK